MAAHVTVLFRITFGTLHAAIASLIAQNFPEWKMLLIDNTGTNGCTEIAQRCAERASRVKFLHEPHIGIAYALNTGLAHAYGKSDTHLDTEEVFRTERPTRQNDLLSSHEHFVKCFMEAPPAHPGRPYLAEWVNLQSTCEKGPLHDHERWMHGVPPLAKLPGVFPGPVGTAERKLLLADPSTTAP